MASRLEENNIGLYTVAKLPKIDTLNVDWTSLAKTTLSPAEYSRPRCPPVCRFHCPGWRRRGPGWSSASPCLWMWARSRSPGCCRCPPGGGGHALSCTDIAPNEIFARVWEWSAFSMHACIHWLPQGTHGSLVKMLHVLIIAREEDKVES
jgi:hypothetical protein